MPGFTIILTIAHQPDEEVATLARTSYQTWGRVIDDHVLGFFYLVRSWNCIPTFQLNFNPQPRRVARIIRGYIDQSMLAPTESRTSLPIEGCERLVSGPIAALTTWRLRAKHAWHRFFVDVKKKSDSPGSLWTWQTSRQPPPVGHNVSATDDCESSWVRDRRYARADILKRIDDGEWRLDHFDLSIHVRSLSSSNDQLKIRKSTMISADDYWWWKWVEPAGNARWTGDLGKWWHVTRIE